MGGIYARFKLIGALGSDFDNCARWQDACLINSVFRAATDAGVLIVNSAGNEGHGAGVRMDYPGCRPEILAVAGLGDNSDTYSPPNYDTAPLWDNSSKGGVQIGTYPSGAGGSWTTTAGIGVTAPAVFRYVVAGAPNSYESIVAGTSLSAPSAAGAAALFRQSLNSIGWAGNNARLLLTSMILMGDGWDGGSPTYDGTSPGAVLTSGLSPYSGAGRVHMHFPGASNLTAPYGWGYRWFNLIPSENETPPRSPHSPTCWPVGGTNYRLSPPISQWKWAVTWADDDLTFVSDIDLYVYDTCHANQQVASQTDYDFRNRIQLRGASLLSGGDPRCLQMCVVPYNVPTGGKVIYSMDYFHSGNPNDH